MSRVNCMLRGVEYVKSVIASRPGLDKPIANDNVM